MDVRLVLIGFLLLVSCQSSDDPSWPPGVQPVPDEAPVYAPNEALDRFYMPPGYELELVAAEPHVQAPVAIDFDADGRLWVVEMPGYMPTLDREGERQARGKVVVLRDTSGDGRMDSRTVFMDGLRHPRTLKVLEHGTLVGEPPHLWFVRDTSGNFRADEKTVVRSDYGDPDQNPEHNANGLLWGLDNWIHNSKYGGRLRLRGNEWEYQETLRLGQWGLSMDDFGRIYRNYNADPLRVDLVSPHYYARNSNLERTRGVYDRAYEDDAVWPVRPTPGVNRGYRDGVLREDSTLASFTAAGTPVAYRGDQLPSSLRNDVFVTEPAGNLVRRYRMTEQANGRLLGRNPYEGAEFLASTDERFRPVNLYSAPDGTLYVVDMYRGLIQHRDYLTGYLQRHVEEHDLLAPLRMGRIYRVVHQSTDSSAGPSLSDRGPDGLAKTLTHPNGWWRDAAQRLLVERGDTSAASVLRDQVRLADSVYTRLHALWSLEGIDRVDPTILDRALSDSSPHVRAAAIRIGERYLEQTEHPFVQTVLQQLGDEAPEVRRQMAASLGERPLPDREDALMRVLEQHASDPLVVSLVVSGLEGEEASFLERLLNESRSASSSPGMKDAIETLTATILRSDREKDLQTLVGWIGNEERPPSQRLALLDGFDAVAPPAAEPQVQRLELPFRPAGLLAATKASDDSVQIRAQSVEGRVGWPGKPRPERPDVQPLTPVQKQMYERGRQAYTTQCAECHGADGQGLEGVAPSLIGSDLALGNERRLARLVLHGLERDQLMPAMKQLSDGEIAEILTFVRRAWDHKASPVDTSTVLEVRGETMDRNEPFTEDDL